ncbi:hypothetical protein EIMP300_81030 [Escherichia coli]|uniref:Glycosyl transferase family 28 C-terminal domain-containing protein n=1 Tax=Escherichia coli TaxID=562 RepID=A0A8S0G4F9_ECOLX|nr:hypothetical protein EIMP300_81030 [Escherichia coli]
MYFMNKTVLRAGLTNKWLAKIATKVMQAFPGAFPNAEVVGNPVRTDVLALPLPQQRLAGREGPVRVLVVGGSQGARILNQTMPQVAAKLGDSVTIWHQSGKGSQQSVEQAYAEVGQPQHKVTEFIDDMAAAYAWADVVVCRSGALTVSEIAAAGLPALFVPFQHKDRQQYWNALRLHRVSHPVSLTTTPLEKAGAAKIIEQSQLSVDAVANTLAGWSRETLLTMAERARAASIPDATERVANEVSRAARA